MSKVTSIKSKKPFRNKYAQIVEQKVEAAEDAFAINPDTIGIVSAGSKAAERTHLAGRLLSKAILKRDVAKARFDIWMAHQRIKVRDMLLAEREHKLKAYVLSPASKRGFKPTEPKEKEIDDYIKTTTAYRKWREELADLEYAVNMADKAYAKPLDQRVYLIMNLGNVVNREAAE